MIGVPFVAVATGAPIPQLVNQVRSRPVYGDRDPVGPILDVASDQPEIGVTIGALGGEDERLCYRTTVRVARGEAEPGHVVAIANIDHRVRAVVDHDQQRRAVDVKVAERVDQEAVQPG